jgi:hypothetical protein
MTKAARMSTGAVLSLLTLVVACARDAGIIPSAPERRFVGDPARSEGPHLSEWSTPVNLGSVVNSVYTDSDPFISKDGLSLYFHAGGNRGGLGGRDIWVAQRASVDTTTRSKLPKSAEHEDRT